MRRIRVRALFTTVLFCFALGSTSGAELIHRYSFTSDANDSVGTADGVLVGGAVLNGGAVDLDGSSGYVDLPNGLVSALDSITIEVWLTDNGSGNWSRIFDFGNSSAGEDASGTGTQYLFLSPQSGYGTLRGAITTGGGEQLLEWPGTRLPVGEMKHVVWTSDGATQTGRLYVDGVMVSENTGMSLKPSDMGETLNNWIGRSQWSNDAYLNAGITEFRIYDGALTADEVQEDFNYGPEVVALGNPVMFLTQPQSETVEELHPVRLEVTYSGAPPVSVQWFRGANAIPGATNDTYVIPSVSLADDDATFHVVLTNSISNTTYTATSTNAVLSVTPDLSPPMLLRAASLFPNGVLLTFSEGLQAGTATNTANYVITYPGGSLAVTGARLDEGASNVVLATAAQSLSTVYTLTVNGVHDLANASNLIATDSQVQFTASPYVTDDIGSPSISGSLTPVAGGYNVVAGGWGIGGTGDQFSFSHRAQSGDFDLQLRVASLDFSGAWARAGLMARDGLASNAMYAACFATPSLAGCHFGSRTSAGGSATMAGTFPVNYPDTWLRLRRTGDFFEGFASLDGQTWQRLGFTTINMPSTVEVGLAVTSGNAGTSTTAEYRNESTGSGSTSESLALPFEPLGPCSRRTPLVISEIMYDAPSAWGGTNSLEFVELWNSGLITEDLTGHRLTGEISYQFPDGTTIAPGQFLVVAKDPAAAQSFYGVTCLGPYEGKLANGGGSLRLLNELGGRLLDIDYDNKSPWPVAANGAGHSLVLSHPSYGENDPRAWSASDVIGGSPGHMDHYGTELARGVVINEFLAHTDDPQVDYIELFNTEPQPVDLSGAWLSDDASTNKFRIPDGTTIQGRGFLAYDQNQLGFALSADGEQIFLVNSNQTRVLDAIDFRGQANGVTTGRYPDGAPSFQELSTVTEGAANTAPLQRPVVINEVMYHPISESKDDEYIEIYNRGGNGVDLSNWRLQGGVSFTFPSNTVIAGHSYLVIAENLTNLLANYSQLNATNTLGNYGGALKDSSERITLTMPEDLISTNEQGVITTNIFHIPVNEVTYLDGGRWGQWSDGYGSSLELIDPDADNRLAANWADSDESSKAPWTTIDVTSILENGHTGGQGVPNRFELFLHGPGEVVVDNLQFLNNSGGNLLNNGDFSSGASGWTFGGVTRRSFLENGVGIGGSTALHLVATARGDTGANKVSHALSSTATTGGANTGTIRAQVRWLKGAPDILLRVRGNWMEVSQQLNVPSNCGTPGLPNSRLVANAGPAILDVSHAPILPVANQVIVVSARAMDPDGVGTVTLHYRVDPATSYTSVSMHDDGTFGDSVAGDGLYSARLQGRASGTLVAFYVTATDSLGAAGQFPDAAPARECLVRWGESVIAGSIGTYRLWLTSSNINFWKTRERNANDPIDATFVYGNSRVIYNVGTLYSGSPFHSGAYNGPTGSFPNDYEINFPVDNKFLGSEPFVLGAEQVGGDDFWFDYTAQVDLTGTWIGRKLGQQYNYRRHVHVLVNGLHRGTIYQDSQQPNSEMLDEYYPNDSGGHLRKIEDWFEFADDAANFTYTTATIARFNKSDGSIDTKRYRWNWKPRVTRNYDDWFAFTNLVAAVNDTGAANYENRVRAWMDVRDFLRPIATHHICGDWDSYGYERGKNMYAYKPEGKPWRLLLWDIELALGNGSRAPNDSIYSIHDPALSAFITGTPAFHREYLMAFQEAVDTVLAPGVADTLLDERYANLLQNGVMVASPQSIENFISQRRSYLQGILPSATFAVDGSGSFTVSSNSITLSGSAPLQVEDILVNGAAYPLTWTDTTTWRLVVPLDAGLNSFTITGVDASGNELPGASASVTVNYTGGTVEPEGNVVFNEIMSTPSVPGGEFVELFNTHSNSTFDLSGWRINGLSYTFPNGSILRPRNYLVLVKDPFTFSSVFPDTPIFDTFDGSLDVDGETLTLFRPGAWPAGEIVVDRVRYEQAAPWVAATNGSSLQLVDASRDNSRVANWDIAEPMPGGSRQTIIPITHTWKYYQSGDLGTAWRAPDYNDASWPSGAALLHNESSSLPAPKNTLLTLGQMTYYFRTTFNFSGNPVGATLHLSTIVDDGLVVYLNGTEVQRVGMNPGTVSYSTPASRSVVNAVYEGPFNLPASSLVEGSNVLAVEVHQNIINSVDVAFGLTLDITPGSVTGATPGAPNNVATNLPAFPDLWLNELQAGNVTGPTDNFGEHEPWMELYNAGSSSFNLAGYYLSDNYTNLTQWAFPSSASIPAGGFLTVWCDSETGETAAGSPHAAFRLASGAGHVALSRITNGGPQIVDYLNYTNLPSNWSYGDVPDGQPFYRSTMFYPTPGGTNNSASAPLTAFINEWMADNVLTKADPADGDFEDWFEIYNPGTNTVDLGGYYLTDDLTDKFHFEIPANGHYTIPPGGHLLVWADNESGQNSTNRADLHVNFALSKNGESIGLYAGDGTPIDALSFLAETTDVSEGRFPDGGAKLYHMPTPTPGSANVVPNTAPTLDPIPDQVLALGQTVGFTVSARDSDVPPQSLTFSLSGQPSGATIQPSTGQFLWTPTAAPTTNTMSVIVTDNGSPSLSATQTFAVIVAPPPQVGGFEMNGDQVSFSWSTVVGLKYRVYYKEQLEEAYWNPLSEILEGTGSPLSFTTTVTGSGQRFYRVAVEP